eukprot:TRINITY_DN3366_c0_g1_i2.p1 TRINITY_DN3366_c0_g1~~TRINITY_DN3366_c0_g1_i2.p1  ORF type:complete len:474 (-),score=180.23 TRINITY_DN3366_c0_g1_i2:227-1648(-)
MSGGGGGITGEHLLLNSNHLQVCLPREITSPDLIFNNENEEYEWKQLSSKEDLFNYLPLSFALQNSRGGNAWQSLSNNVKIKQKKHQSIVSSDSSSLERTPCDSFIEIYLPFRSDADLFQRYKLFESDRIRLGKIIEDLDALAADIAYKHVGEGSIDKYTIVTAGMDRVVMFYHVNRERDVCIRGSVTMVGNTSMEVRLLVLTVGESSSDLLSQATFSMVCRDKATYKAAKVPSLNLVTEYDKWCHQEGLAKREKRRLNQEKDFKRAPPLFEEISEIHKFYFDHLTTNYPNSSLASSPSEKTVTEGKKIPMSSTEIQTVEVMHGQERNIHNKIFGGHLMRLAFELASINAYSVTGVYPVLRSMDDVQFFWPVEIGSLLSLKSSVQYIESKLVFIVVAAEMTVTSSLDRPKKLTNEFHFSFLCDSIRPLPSIIPSTYPEIVNYLDGRRRSIEMAQENPVSSSSIHSPSLKKPIH